MYCQCLRLFCRAAQGSGLGENESKAAVCAPHPRKLTVLAQLLLPQLLAEGFDLFRGTPAEPALGVAFGEVNVPTNGHTVCVAT